MSRFKRTGKSQMPDVFPLKEEITSEINCFFPLKNRSSFKGASSFKGIRPSNGDPCRPGKNQRVPLVIIPIGIPTNVYWASTYENNSKGIVPFRNPRRFFEYPMHEEHFETLRETKFDD